MTNENVDRRSLFKGMLAGGSLAAGGMCAGFGIPTQTAHAQSLSGAQTICVRQAGARGDGQTHDAEVLQRILNDLSSKGGGIADFPPGRYVLEKTLLIPSGVHIIGHGPSTILEGFRPNDINGYALIANQGIVTKKGYEGASDFSLRNIAIDSPRTNGIVLVHARNGYFTHIYGVDAHHHHFDIAGSKNIIAENIYLTGRSGTAPFQIDGSPYYNNIWDGQTNIAPIRDETENDGIFLSRAVIHPTNRPNHGIHLHRDGGRNIFIDSVLIEHVENGVFRDRNTHRTDMFLSNIVIKDVAGHGINFRNTDKPDQRVSLNNIVIQDVHGEGLLEYHGCQDLTIGNVKAIAGGQTGAQRLAFHDVHRCTLDALYVYGNGSGCAILLRDCEHVFIAKTIAQSVHHSLCLEDCAGIRYSGLCELAQDGSTVEPRVSGRECLAHWSQS